LRSRHRCGKRRAERHETKAGRCASLRSRQKPLAPLRDCSFGPLHTIGAVGPLIDGELERLCQMQRAALGELRDLGATTEAVGQDQGVAGLLANGRKQSALAAGPRNLVFAGLEAERPSEPAAA